MIKSTGAEYVIIGHSERRSYYNEDNSILNRKISLALGRPESNILLWRDKGRKRITKALRCCRKTTGRKPLLCKPEDMKYVVIAYEPVWAIGTGLTATPAQAQEMHKYIRNLIKEKYGSTIADNMTILYGGSCKPSNAAEIFSNPDVDGGLIGGASLRKKILLQSQKAF